MSPQRRHVLSFVLALAAAVAAPVAHAQAALDNVMAKKSISIAIPTDYPPYGFVGTDMTASLSDELKAKITESVPLKRIGTPEDIAAAVKFLAGDDAGYITGHVLDVNGGMFMG